VHARSVALRHGRARVERIISLKPIHRYC